MNCFKHPVPSIFLDTPFLQTHQLLKSLPTIALSDLCLSMALLYGIYVLIKILIIGRLFNGILDVGYVVAGGIPYCASIPYHKGMHSRDIYQF